MGNFFGDVYNGITNALKNLATKSVDAVAAAFAGTVDAIKKAGNATKNVALQAASEISLVLTNIVKLFISGFQVLIMDFGRMLPSIIIDAIKGLGNLSVNMSSIMADLGYTQDEINKIIPSLDKQGS